MSHQTFVRSNVRLQCMTSCAFYIIYLPAASARARPNNDNSCNLGENSLQNLRDCFLSAKRRHMFNGRKPHGKDTRTSQFRLNNSDKMCANDVLQQCPCSRPTTPKHKGENHTEKTTWTSWFLLTSWENICTNVICYMFSYSRAKVILHVHRIDHTFLSVSIST